MIPTGGILNYREKNIRHCGWKVDEWVWSNGEMILKGEY